MPPSVILITREEASIKKIDERLRPRFEWIDRLPDRVVVRFPSAYVAINFAPSVVEDFEPDELSAIRELISRPTFFLVEYHDEALLKIVLATVCEGQEMLVDDAHGAICPCSVFVVGP